MNIGWAQADITPEGVVDLTGQYYSRESRGIHSRLEAVVMAVEGGRRDQAVLISVDLLNFSRLFLRKLREELKGRIPDLDVSKVIMNATHVHTAPAVTSARDWKEETSELNEYAGYVIERVGKAVAEAWEARSDAGVANSFDFAAVGHCRRAVYRNNTAEMYGDTSREDFLGMEGNEDSTVELLFTFDAAAKPTGVVVNVACPSQVMEATYFISSDYMGEVRRLLKEKFGSDFHVLCQISAAGCQSPRDLARNRDDAFWSDRGVTILGKRVFDAVMRGYDQVNGNIVSNPDIVHQVREIALPKRRASYAEYTAVVKEIERLEKIQPEKEAFEEFYAEVLSNEKIPGRPGPYDSKLHHFVLIKNAKAVIQRYEQQQAEPNYRMELHTVKLGDVVFVTNPFELFLDYGLRIKARSRAEQTFVVQLACGRGSYLPTERAERLGGYGGLIVNGEVGSDGGNLLVDATVESIHDIMSTTV